ncbi:Pentatricopeptide repeat-containing protein At5g66631 [Linum perenne]
MNFSRFPVRIAQLSILNQQVRFFHRDPFPSSLTHYLRRAELIDSIRLQLRSKEPSSLLPLLKNRLSDAFVVTQAIRSVPNADSALSLVETLKDVPHFQHNQATLHALATVLAKSGRNCELNSLIQDINSYRYPRVRVSFMNLLYWYSTAGDMNAVLDTWNEYRVRGDKRLCTESYNIVMGIHAKKGDALAAVGVFCTMIDEGAIPNSRTYTVIIEHLVECGKLNSALEVFNVLPRMRVKRTSKQYLVLVNGFVKAKRFDEVKTLFDVMKADGKYPGRAMWMALQELREAGYVEETDLLLEGMFPDGRIKSIVSLEESSDEEKDESFKVSGGVDVDVHDVVKLKPWLDPKALADALRKWNPEVVSTLEHSEFVWTTRLVCKVLRNFKSPETAWGFFCWVAYQPGFTHDVYTVQRMIAILSRHGKVELVNQLIAKVRNEGMTMPISTIRLIIEFYGISKNADAALKVFRDDRALCGHINKYNLMILYSALLRTLTKCKRDSDSIEVLEEMMCCGICPDSQTFSGLMYYFALQGDIKTVQKLFTMVRQNGVGPDAYMFKVLIQAYCKCERAALALRVFEDMRSSNLMPDPATKDMLVKSLWKEGRRKEAASVVESCEESNQVLPLVLQGHLWTVCSADLRRVYDIYSKSFETISAMDGNMESGFSERNMESAATFDSDTVR